MISFPSRIGQYNIYYPLSKDGRTPVYYGTDDKGNKLAIKVSANSTLLNEYNIMKNIGDPNIMKAVDLISEEPYHFLVMKMANCDLANYIKSTANIDEQIIKKIMFSLLSGIKSLHSYGIWHRDIKPQNILIFNDGPTFECVLSDFEFSDYFGIQMPKHRSGTPLFFAPEILSKSKYTNKIDLWAAGIVMYMIYKRMNLPFQNKECLMKGIINNTDGIPPLAQDLIRHLICVDPIKRYSASQALNHPFFMENEVRETSRTLEEITQYLPGDSPEVET